MRVVLYLLAVILMGAIKGCTSLEYYGDSTNPQLAKVGNKSLYYKDVASLMTQLSSTEDSIKFINTYTQSWVKQQLNNDLANQLFADQQEDIELLVERYRNTLLKYKLQNHYSSLVDTTISSEEVSHYYQQNINQYKLHSPIVKAKVLVMPLNYSKSRVATTTFHSTKTDAEEDLQAIVQRDNLSLYDFEEDWVYLSEVAKYVPFPKISYDSYVSSKKRDKITDSQNIYLIDIQQYRKSGEVMPLKYVEQSIKKSIINARRAKHFKIMEDSLFLASKTREDIIITDIDSILLNTIKDNQQKDL